MRARFVLAAVTPLLIGLNFIAAGACSFPDVTFQENGGGSPGSASSGAGSGGGGQGGQGGQGGGGGSASGAGGGEGGQGGQGGQGGADCTDPDKDDDNQAGVDCSGTDCDDNDPDVFVGQMNYFEKARPNGSFDYNCNNAEEREFETVKCSGSFCTAKTNVFIGDPANPAACGIPATFGDCNGFCKTSNLSVKPMRCH